MSTLISQIPATAPAEAYAHFVSRLRFETDCSDVFHTQQTGEVDYILVDVRSPDAFAQAHVPGAINIPTKLITAQRMAEFGSGTLFVVYCAGPHCNGVHKAAARIASLNYAVKEMIGGVTGWLDEGLSLVGEDTTQVTVASGISCAC